jgi:hypothetical protein
MEPIRGVVPVDQWRFFALSAQSSAFPLVP